MEIDDSQRGLTLPRDRKRLKAREGSFTSGSSLTVETRLADLLCGCPASYWTALLTLNVIIESPVSVIELGASTERNRQTDRRARSVMRLIHIGRPRSDRYSTKSNKTLYMDGRSWTINNNRWQLKRVLAGID